MESKVDAYIAKHEKWIEELEAIRSVLLDVGMTESFKWSTPVYMVNNKNVISFGAFKNHYGIWFFNGVFLKDEHNLLVIAQESTKAMRQIRFEKGTKIDWTILREYILEAIENQKKGLKLKAVKTKAYEMSDLLQSSFSDNEELSLAFKSLSFGKQKEYANYISEAKQHKTKLSRIEKIKPMIIAGIGLHDKYRNC